MKNLIRKLKNANQYNVLKRGSGYEIELDFGIINDFIVSKYGLATALDFAVCELTCSRLYNDHSALVVANALSESFEITTTSMYSKVSRKYAKGIPIEDVIFEIKDSDMTMIRFEPDRSILTD